MRSFVITILLYVLATVSVYAERIADPAMPQITSDTTSEAVLPTSKRVIKFQDYAEKGYKFLLTGVRPKLDIDFNIRKDQLLTKGQVFIEFTPSPSLISKESHLKVHINENLVGIVNISEQELGKPVRATLQVNPLFIKDFNRITFTFVGQYDAICPTWSSPALWLEISENSKLTLFLQQIPLANDLSSLPIPFYDPMDESPLHLSLSLSDLQNKDQQLAASILSSWFGTLSEWRGISVSVSSNVISKANTIVFITNEHRPKALNDYPKATAPTIEIMDNPTNQFSKLLVISGRDNQDLIKAVTALAQAPQLFRGHMITIEKIKQLQTRKPYDAPFWIDTKKPTTFASLKTYAEQLQTMGIEPPPVFLKFKTPPDLYLNHTQGIELNLMYQYSEPSIPKTSKLNVSLNNSFVRSFILHGENVVTGIIPGMSYIKNTTQTKKRLHLPVPSLGNNNQLAFDFDYSFIAGEGNLDGQCISTSRETNYGKIDERSTIDFSNYRHYIAMPNLRVFMFGGFPYSRMADLSETIAFLPQNATPNQLALLFNLMGRIGAETGLPVYRLKITHDWSDVKSEDADIIAIGNLPSDFENDKLLSIYLTKKQSWLKAPVREQTSPSLIINAIDAEPVSKTTTSAQGALGAIAQVQSPYYKNRSLVAFLAGDSNGFSLLNQLMESPKKLQDVYGSVSIVRTSGVKSMTVGDVYYVGHIPLIVKVWYILKNYPISLAFFALVGAIIAGWLIKRLFLVLAKRRLSPHSPSSWEE